jgi:hypothetical protein
MTSALAERADVRSEPVRAAAHVTLSGGRLTLDELMSTAWSGVSAGAPVACPVCGDRMDPTGADAASCRSCASVLS